MMHMNWYLLANRQVSLLAWGIVRGWLMIVVFDFTCLMDPEAALTFTHGHFNLVVVYQYIKELQGY